MCLNYVQCVWMQNINLNSGKVLNQDVLVIYVKHGT